ncbi:hypothetical protein [Consotaella salsifontis]|uniref:Dephospho-CoA kinase n=1 Tax=Consotaella salsifontis TaxID=1365950 RepID=A0A1T4SRU5_9HYPH|nr:hypothetical protein [Consotaella salsifontis]SKA30872.1 hypothetical protein SAMN05428963_11378 [Consotaella salsifontis]
MNMAISWYHDLMAETFGDPDRYVAANDNREPMIIGLTGLRNVGKTSVADVLVDRHGFARTHAFEGGKEAAVAYFEHITGDVSEARKMVYGILKDRPSPHLPGGVAPRHFLERFGHFMGADMGVEWTLAMEIAVARRIAHGRPIVVESVVYEAPWLKAQGGIIVRVERPGHVGPAGIESDAVQAAVGEDFRLVNGGGLADLESAVAGLLADISHRRRAA